MWVRQVFSGIFPAFLKFVIDKESKVYLLPKHHVSQSPLYDRTTVLRTAAIHFDTHKIILYKVEGI